jgi:hypothetical protein
MKDYMFAGRGNAGSLGTKDSAGRELDAAGKLKKQTARKDLEATGGVDLKRKPGFRNA